MASVVTQEILDAVGVESAPKAYVAEAGAIRRFAEAIGDTNPRHHDGSAAHPTFLRSFDHVPPPPEFDIPYLDILDGGSDWKFFDPVRAGDKIVVTTKIVNVFQKTGSLGEMLFIVREHQYVKPNRGTTAIQTSTTIYYNVDTPLRQAQGRPAPRPSPSWKRGQIADKPCLLELRHEPMYVEDVSLGTIIPTLRKVPSTRQLVQYAGASGDFYEIHYDQEFARLSGLPEVIVHGALKSAFLAEMLTNWFGEQGFLRRLSVQYRGMDLVGAAMHCKGVVTSVAHTHSNPLPQGDTGQEFGRVDCDLWTESEDGTKTTVGNAVVSLPSRLNA